MGVDVFEVDKSGDDVLTINYSIVLIKNDKIPYGYRIPSSIQKELINDFKEGLLGIKNKINFKVRFHTKIIILLLKEAIKGRKPNNPCKILICNDLDGHFHEIRDMIVKNLKNQMPNLKKENITQAYFNKDSLINKVAKALNNRNNKILQKYNVIKCDFKLNILRDIIKK